MKTLRPARPDEALRVLSRASGKTRSRASSALRRRVRRRHSPHRLSLSISSECSPRALLRLPVAVPRPCQTRPRSAAAPARPAPSPGARASRSPPTSTGASQGADRGARCARGSLSRRSSLLSQHRACRGEVLRGGERGPVRVTGHPSFGRRTHTATAAERRCHCAGDSLQQHCRGRAEEWVDRRRQCEEWGRGLLRENKALSSPSSATNVAPEEKVTPGSTVRLYTTGGPISSELTQRARDPQSTEAPLQACLPDRRQTRAGV